MKIPMPDRPRCFQLVTIAVLGYVLPFAPQLLAQTHSTGDPEGWDFTIAPYLVMPWMNGTTAVRGNEVTVDAGPKDIFSKLQLGAMGYFEARKNKWGIGADAMYMALGTTVDRVPILGTRATADVDFNQGAYTFVGLRELNKNADFLFGARWNVLQGRIGFKGPQETVVKQTQQWVDPVFGLKVKKHLGGRLSFSMEGDVGGFGAGSDFAWSLFPLIGIDAGKHATLKAGYRVLGANYKTGSGDTLFKYDIITQGIVLGVVFHR